jgi:hypothetical protein
LIIKQCTMMSCASPCKLKLAATELGGIQK